MNLRDLFSRWARPNDAPPADAVDGERTQMTSVNRERTLRSRMVNLVLALVIGSVGVGAFIWYYQGAAARRAAAVSAEKTARDKLAAGGQRLPSLGHIEPPKPPSPTVATTTDVSMRTTIVGDTPPPAPNQPASSPPAAAGAASGPPPKTAAEILREMQFAPGVMQPRRDRAAITTVGASITPGGTLGGGGGDSALGAMLRPTVTPSVSARLLPDRRFLLTKGTMIDCTLETAIDSTLPGMTRCVGAGKVFSDDGSIVLLEEGTKFVGETKGEVRQGQARVFVLWTEATTRTGVRINLDSPGTDSLGRSGLAGWVDTHFWDRFGAAIMLSIVDGTVAALASSGGGNSGGTAVAINPSTSNVAGEVLKNTINIPPTVRINQGERIQIMAARDFDFRPVYDVRTTAE